MRKGRFQMDLQSWVESSIRAFFCLAGISGNIWLGVCSLPKAKSPLRPNDFLFINLAASNLITNCLVDLPDTLAQFLNSWFMGRNYCDVIQFSADLSETSSIFSTMFITMYWHQKLVGSLRRGGAPVKMDNLRLVAAYLSASWSVALAFSIPHFFIREHNANESLEVCEEIFPTPEAQMAYDATYLILANIIPLIGMAYASVKIVATLLQSHKRIKGQRNKTTPTQEKTTEARSSRNQVRAAGSVLLVASIFIVCWLIHLVLRIYSNFSTSIVAVKLSNFAGASYTCLVPYVYLYGVRKLNCSCC